MKNLNFLPKDYLEKKELNTYVKRLIAYMAIIFLCVVLIVISLDFTIRYTEQQRIVLDKQVKDEKYILSDQAINEMNAKRAAVAETNKILEAIVHNQTIAVSNIAELTEKIPDKTYAKQIKIDDVTQTLEFEGHTNNKENLILLVHYMMESENFESVFLKSMETEDVNSINFVIESQIEKGEDRY